MTIHYQGHGATLHHGDCLDVLRTLPDASVDSVVTDPPYNLSFMAKPWDAYEGREDAGFAYWLSGLIDGEGHFAIKAHSRGTHAPYFQLKMRADERGTLDRIRRLLGVGVVSIESKEPNPMAKYVIQDKAGCQRLVDLLDKYPLRAKKQLDYWTWREAVCEWTSRPRGNRWHGAVDNAHMAELRSRLMENRAYTDVPWSGHEFQDWCRLWATECLRVLKPGGHLLAFGGTRTWHRLACAVEDAGFEVRDSIAWLYGSGFPKSLDVSKAIDKRRTEDAEPVRAICRAIRAAMDVRDLRSRHLVEHFDGCHPRLIDHWAARDTDSQPALPTWEQWEKLRDLFAELAEHDAEAWRLNGRKGSPGEAWDAREITGHHEQGNPIGVYEFKHGEGNGRTANERRDIPATPDAERWQGWGTALKPAFEPVVVARKPLSGTVAGNVLAWGTGALNVDGCRVAGDEDGSRNRPPSRLGSATTYAQDEWTRTAVVQRQDTTGKGRWPANVVLDESQAEALDEQSGESRDGTAVKRNRSEDGRAPYKASSYMITDRSREDQTYGGQGGASRFFYVAKADASERPRVNGTAHPTVKPLSLMRWLVRLVTPPGGTVLEPFAGSGTTVEACIIEGFQCIAIEREADYLPLIRQRIDRRRDPVEALRGQAADLGLFDLLGGEGA